MPMDGWTPLTTRLLAEGGNTAWNYFDSSSATSAAAVLDEVRCNGWLQKLLPARTEFDRLQQLDGGRPETPSNDILQHNNVRGDFSVFIDRKYRQRPCFPDKFPKLSSLISSIERTATTQFSDCTDFQFDLSLTSVQISKFPVGTSYPQHIDVKSDQRNDKILKDKESSLPSVHTQQPHRLLTFIYYLTDGDWNCRTDGGCLRVFHSESLQTTSHTDICPYSGRIVVFRSDVVEHAVLPPLRRPRHAVTVWLYGHTRTHDEPVLKNEESGSSAKVRAAALAIPESRRIESPLPLPTFETNIGNDTTSTIFVSIASYRDSETGPTIQSLMAEAAYASRVYVGLVLQIDTKHNVDDRTVVDLLPTPDSSDDNGVRGEPTLFDRVRVLRMDARHSSGPCPARALCQQLYRNEKYVLQIDAHMRFRKNWDVYLIHQLNQCPVPERSMLSAYPVGYTLPNLIPNEVRGTMLLPWKFGPVNRNGDTMLQIRGRVFRNRPHSGEDKPLLCHLYAAGFNFSFAKPVLTECPYDGTLHNLFFGEEISMAVRLFTAGFDIYAPAQSVCYHLWSRSHRPPALAEGNDASQAMRESHRDESMATVRDQVLGVGRGLGSSRTAVEFASAIGVDFSTNEVLRDKGKQPEYEHMLAKNFEDVNSDLETSSATNSKVSDLEPKLKDLVASFLS